MNLLDLQNIPIRDKVYNFGIKDKRISGLSVRVKANGEKEYIYRYRFFDKQPTINLGDVFSSNYEDIVAKVKNFNELLKQGYDPAIDNEQQLNPYYEYKGQQFKIIAQLWIDHQIKHKNPSKQTLYNYRYVTDILNKHIGDIMIDNLKPVTMLNVCQAIQQDYSENYGILARRYAGMIFRFGMTYEICRDNPTSTLAEQLTKPVTINHPAVTEEADFKKLLIDTYNFKKCHKIIWHAINLMPFVFVRSNDLLNWRWEDINFEKNQWIFEPSKKGRSKSTVESLVVPLSKPVLKRLDAVREYTGLSSGLVFPSPKTLTLDPALHQPMGKTTLLKALHRMGYKGEHCVHGFRASAKTILMQKKEFRYSDTATELQLAHKLVDSYGRAYNRMTEIEERTRMMNDWGDYLESLIVPLDDISENNA